MDAVRPKPHLTQLPIIPTHTQIPFPRRSRAPTTIQNGQRFGPAGGYRCGLPLGGLEEGDVRREAEGGAHLAAAGRGILWRGAAARGGGVDDEVAGEAEQREEELVQHRTGLRPSQRQGVSLGFPRDREEEESDEESGRRERRKRAGTGAAGFRRFFLDFETL